jgi:hypothetical protein
MLDKELILETFEPGELQSIGDALQILHMLGVFTLQVQRNSSRVANSFQDQDAEALAKEILQVRQTNRQLLALHELAGNFKEGLSNES